MFKSPNNGNDSRQKYKQKINKNNVNKSASIGMQMTKIQPLITSHNVYKNVVLYTTYSKFKVEGDDCFLDTTALTNNID